MSREYEDTSPLKVAEEAERDLNSYSAKIGHDNPARLRGAGDSTLESGVDETVTNKFPGSTVTYGSAASGAGDNREIPLSEGGGLDPTTGKPYKARDFEGLGGPEDKAQAYAAANPGNDDVRESVRSAGQDDLNESAPKPDNIR